jgi:hypothetical protein
MGPGSPWNRHHDGGGPSGDPATFFFTEENQFGGLHNQANDTIVDFVKGQDKIMNPQYFSGEMADIVSFFSLDSNGNNILDNGDDAVSIASRTVDGAAKTSTIIDMSLTDIGADVTGTITVFGVTGMTASDFVY